MRVVLIDAMNLAFRAQYTAGALTTAAGTPSGVIYGFLRILKNVHEKFGKNPLLIMWEGGHLQVTKKGETYKIVKPEIPNWRKALPRQQYKGNRKVNQSVLDAHAQIPEVQKALTYLRYPQFSVPGLEGDDLIGIASELLKDYNYDEIAIVSSDRDFFQLISKKHNINVYRPGKGKLDRYTWDKVEEVCKVKPTKWATYKALIGDSSDHYDGIPGCGPVTAIEMIAYGADPRLKWDFQPKEFKLNFWKFETQWQKAMDAYVLAEIPLSISHPRFTLQTKKEASIAFKDFRSKIQRKFTTKELKESIELFSRFCSKWEMHQILSEKRKYFSGVVCDGNTLV